MPYNPTLVAPMRAEVTRLGAKELTTAAEVDAALGDQRGSMLVFVNSVCGCAAGNARPALALALRHSVVPQQVVTVFAGQDLEAAARAPVLRGVPAEQPFHGVAQGRRGGPLHSSAPDRGTHASINRR
jgi:putative YphP/YqiW family bacilliredoxin